MRRGVCAVRVYGGICLNLMWTDCMVLAPLVDSGIRAADPGITDQGFIMCRWRSAF